jgi:hypothetical protein
MLLKRFQVYNISALKSLIVINKRTMLNTLDSDPEYPELYNREYEWTCAPWNLEEYLSISHVLRAKGNVHPFLYGWEGHGAEDMAEWAEWYTAYEANKPKNFILNGIYSELIEPLDVEIYFYYESKESRRKAAALKEALDNHEYVRADMISFEIEEEAETLFGCYIYDTEKGASINDYFETAVVGLFWEWVFFWGIGAYVMLIDMRWAFYTVVGFLNKYLVISWNFIYEFINSLF